MSMTYAEIIRATIAYRLERYKNLSGAMPRPWDDLAPWEHEMWINHYKKAHA